MRKEISSDEILTLHQFCKRHFVHYYDVRLELVDHLASSIEALWEQEPELDFWKALDRVYKNYGATGFRKLMAAKEKQVTKDFTKGMRYSIPWLFGWPNAIIVGVYIIICYYFYQFYSTGNGFIPSYFLGTLACLEFLLSIFVSIKITKWSKASSESLISTSYSHAFTFVYFGQFFLINNLTSFLFDSEKWATKPIRPEAFIVYACIAAICLIATTVQWRQARHCYQKARRDYPTLFSK